MPLGCYKHFPGQSASIIIAFEFFGMFVSARTPSVFLGGSGSCACFRNNIPFFQPSSCFLWSDGFDNQQHFALNSLWLIVCHWWAGIFANKFCHFDKTIVMCRSVTRLDGAWGKKQVWRPHVRTWGLSEANVGLLFWKKWLWHCCDFLSPCSDSAPEKLCPIDLSLRLWCYAIKIGKFSENEQIFK